MMFLAKYKTFKSDKYSTCKLYSSKWMDIFHRDTFYVEELHCIAFKTSGKTYADRKESVRNIAIDYSNMDCGGLSWGEINCIESWFNDMAKRYGLVEEFTENGII